MTSCARLLTASADDFFFILVGREAEKDRCLVYLAVHECICGYVPHEQTGTSERIVTSLCFIFTLLFSSFWHTEHREDRIQPRFPHVDQGSNTCTHESKTKRQVRASACRWYRGSVRLKTCAWILFTMKLRGK